MGLLDFALPTQALHLKTQNAFEQKADQDPLPVFLPDLDAREPSN